MGENKDADQLRGNREADQRLCFRYTDSTFPPLLIPKFSRFWVSSVTVQAGLCWTWSETQIVGFVMHRLNCQGTYQMTDYSYVQIRGHYFARTYNYHMTSLFIKWITSQWTGNYGQSLYSIIFLLPRFGTIFCLPKKTQNRCPISGVFTHKIHEYCTIDHEINICSEK